MTRWKELPPKKQLLIGFIALCVILLAFFIFHTINKQVKKSGADLILVLDGKEAYLPCRVGDAPFQFEPPPRNALTPIDKSPTSDSAFQRDFPEGKWDGEHRFELVGYNESRAEMSLMDYIVRGVKASDFSDVVLRGGKLGGERSKEFLTRGIQIGDSVEEVERILGAPDKPTENGQYAFYYFDTEESGQYLLRLEYSEQKLSMIDLSYTFNAPSTP